jgi:hypothetical protein
VTSSYAIGAQHPPLSANASRWVDDSREGSLWQQLLIAVVGIVLAATLIIGQISVATTRGVQQNLHKSVAQLRQGNTTLGDIIDKAAPSIMLNKVTGQQQAVLQDVLDTMTQLNAAMQQVGATTARLQGTVGTMHQTSAHLAAGVNGMDRHTTTIVNALAPLPANTDKTHAQLARIYTDTAAISTELNAITAKLHNYGLLEATNVRGTGGP